MATYFLGIDGGGSGTRAVIINQAREVIGRGEAGPSNHYSVGASAATENCAAAASVALLQAHESRPEFQPHQVVAWGFGLAGVGREADLNLMRGCLSEICSRPFTLDTDVAAAHAGAFAGKAGIVVSAGTGAIVYGADEWGEKCTADGWGPLMGDEGGGYWIGLKALRAACRSFDGRASSTRLGSAVLDAMEVESPAELVRYVYSNQCTRDQIAALAEVTLILADEGITEAAQIRTDAVQALAKSVKAVARCLLQRHLERGMESGREISPLELHVALRGGLFEDDFLRATLGYAVTEIMVKLKRDYLPLASWRVVKPQYDAAVGAAILAQIRA